MTSDSSDYHQPLQWTKDFSHALINKIEISIGGDDKPAFYCTACGARFEERPVGACNAQRQRFVQSRFDALVHRLFPFLADNGALRERLDGALQNNHFSEAVDLFVDFMSDDQRVEWQSRLDNVEEALLHLYGIEQHYFATDLDDFLQRLLADDKSTCFECWQCDSEQFEHTRRPGTVLDARYGHWTRLCDECQ